MTKKTKKETGESKELQQQAAEAMLSEPVRFEVKGLGKFEIKPLKLGTLISISKEALKIDKPRDKATIVSIIAQAESARPASKIVAKAILNSRWKIKLFSGVLAKTLLWSLTPVELNQLVNIIINQSNAGFFFSSMTLLGSMRIMEPTM